MLRVTNWPRWQRTKGWVAAALWFAAICFIGGLEGEGPMPHPWLAVTSLAASFAIIYTIMRRKNT
jgi:peptidoglycan/LPS O-acetylase OafA/YrhL